mgnify:CR=1 FL=1
MDFSFKGRNVHASTGGVPFDAAKPVVVFLHGAGMDHTVWFLQSRWFAYRGRSVLALDFPGHGRSDGPLLSSIEAMADWTADVLDHLGVKQAAVVGHSMGALAAVSFAARHPEKIARLVILNTAAFASPHLPARIALCKLPRNGTRWLKLCRTIVQRRGARGRLGATGSLCRAGRGPGLQVQRPIPPATSAPRSARFVRRERANGRAADRSAAPSRIPITDGPAPPSVLARAPRR